MSHSLVGEGGRKIHQADEMVSLKKEQRIYSNIPSRPPVMLSLLRGKRTDTMWLHKEQIFLRNWLMCLQRLGDAKI